MNGRIGQDNGETVAAHATIKLRGEKLFYVAEAEEHVVPDDLYEEILEMCARRLNRTIAIPQHTNLPFFAYGLFRPNELGFDRIDELAENVSNSSTRGQLWQRDGLPLLVSTFDEGCIHGALIRFKPGANDEAYRRIAAIEPDDQYRWSEIEVLVGEHPESQVRANALIGRNPTKGGICLDTHDWNGRGDPLFNEALEVVEQVLKDNSDIGKCDLHRVFNLQMAYLLLWSAIERYASLRYHLGTNVTQKVLQIAAEPAFVDSFKRHVSGERFVYSAARRGERVRLSPEVPLKSLRYYYQIRSNITHRGKGERTDFTIVRDSLRELVQIFREVLADAFKTQPRWE
jgi:hypothetical protein